MVTKCMASDFMVRSFLPAYSTSVNFGGYHFTLKIFSRSAKSPRQNFVDRKRPKSEA